MRDEKEMMELILNTAKQDDNICGVYMNGSRANPNAPKDIFQDYDIVYVVKDTAPYIQDKHWIDRFGQRLIMQDVGAEESLIDQQLSYGWLMLFDDGNRIDLHIQTLAYMNKHIHDESFCIILLDKEGIMPTIPQTSDASFHVTRPTQAAFLSTCNEFWWCLNNVAKGLWRDELSYTLDMLNMHVRPQLLTMLAWLAGTNTDFKCSVGKSGKYLSNFIDQKTWVAYLETYCGADVSLGDAIISMMNLFDEKAKNVANILQLYYDETEAENMKYFVHHVMNLSRKATSIL